MGRAARNYVCMSLLARVRDPSARLPSWPCTRIVELPPIRLNSLFVPLDFRGATSRNENFNPIFRDLDARNIMKYCIFDLILPNVCQNNWIME